MTTLIEHVLDGMHDNCQYNGGTFADWNPDYNHPVDVYANSYYSSYTQGEYQRAVEVINKIIDTGARSKRDTAVKLILQNV